MMMQIDSTFFFVDSCRCLAEAGSPWSMSRDEKQFESVLGREARLLRITPPQLEHQLSTG